MYEKCEKKFECDMDIKSFLNICREVRHMQYWFNHKKPVKNQSDKKGSKNIIIEGVPIECKDEYVNH